MCTEKVRLAWMLDSSKAGESFAGHPRFHIAVSGEAGRPRGRNLRRVHADYEAGAAIEDAIAANVPNESDICGSGEREMTWAEWEALAWAYMAHNWRTLRPEDSARVRHRMDIWAGVAVPEIDEEGDGDIGAPEATHDDPGTHNMRG